MNPYNHNDIEKKWQDRWGQDGTYKTKDTTDKPKHYVLDMFPYPSGEGLHVGHPKGYIATDIYARMKTMRGFNVLHPMGWDAFGLPAEQYAIKNKVHPRVAVEKNVARYKDQLSIIGLNYDWSREIDTTDPKYYKWTQWIFLKLLEKGLAYESWEPINWCPTCQTGLANEDLEAGKCERCDTQVEKKPMRQWVLRITAYADRMLEDLKLVDWPESIKESQRNWIGRSEGSEIDFAIKGSNKKITVFTTRPDTLFGVTYAVLAPEHALLDELKDSIGNWADVLAYREAAKAKSEIDRTAEGREKTGVKIEGLSVINPANQEVVPLFVADYVLGNYGTGAVMAVPAHDERDFAFAKKYNLPTKEVIIPSCVDLRNPPVPGKKVVERENVHAIVINPKTNKVLCLKWKKFPWTTFAMGGVEKDEDVIAAARREVLEETGYKDLSLVKVLGGSVRAEYFAAHKDENRVAYTKAVVFELATEERENVASAEEELHEVVWKDFSDITPELLAHAEADIWLSRLSGKEMAFSGDGYLVNSDKFTGIPNDQAKKQITEFVGGRLVVKYRLKEWVFSRQRYWGEPIPVIHCEKCGAVPVPEKDLPVLLPDVESYAPTGTGESPLAAISEWVNTSCPRCGGAAKRETNTMPQWAGSSWYYLRYIDPHNESALVDGAKEKYWSPVDMYVGGAEHATRHLIYARFWHKFLYDLGVTHHAEPFKRLQNVGLIMAEDGRKMSKRWGNVINPDEVVTNYGADTLRLYEMFMGPFNQAVAWSTESIIGARRFLERAWKLQAKVGATTPESVEASLHKAIKKVGDDIETFNFNTAVSALMILANDMERAESFSKDTYTSFLKLLAPFAPHMTEELWYQLGGTESIHLSAWPVFDESKIVTREVTLAIQVNGKVRDEIVVPNGVGEEDVKTLALGRPAIQKWLEGKEVKKVVFVPGKLISIVIA